MTELLDVVRLAFKLGADGAFLGQTVEQDLSVEEIAEKMRPFNVSLQDKVLEELKKLPVSIVEQGFIRSIRHVDIHRLGYVYVDFQKQKIVEERSRLFHPMARRTIYRYLYSMDELKEDFSKIPGLENPIGSGNNFLVYQALVGSGRKVVNYLSEELVWPLYDRTIIVEKS